MKIYSTAIQYSVAAPKMVYVVNQDYEDIIAMPVLFEENKQIMGKLARKLVEEKYI